MDERRKHKRIKRSFLTWLRLIKVVLEQRHLSKWNMVTTHDLSAGGMLFNYDDNIKAGTQVNFRIIFPFSEHAIRCIGKIIRSKNPSEDPSSNIFLVAAEFEKIKQKDKELIKRIADRLC